MQKIPCQLIVCGPAVSKTYLAESDSRFVDLDEMKATYKYGLQHMSREEKEAGKMQRGRAVKEDSFSYIICQIERLLKNGQIGLLSYNTKILSYLREQGLAYCMVYPAKEARDEYIKRMQERGNTKEFIAAMTNEEAWNQFFVQNQNETEAAYKIELSAGQYLSDIKDRFI